MARFQDFEYRASRKAVTVYKDGDGHRIDASYSMYKRDANGGWFEEVYSGKKDPFVRVSPAMAIMLEDFFSTFDPKKIQEWS